MRIVLTGSSGSLGAYLVERILEGEHELIAWSGTTAGERGGVTFHPVDLGSLETIRDRLGRDDPDVVIHAAAISAAEAVRADPERARRVNVLATQRIAEWCGERGRRLIFTSTDMVFDGSRAWNHEDDPAEPVLAYGRTKREAEDAVTAVPNSLVARLSLLYGRTRCGRESFFDRALGLLAKGEPQVFFEDEYRTPLDLGTAACALAALASSTATGIVHVAGAERMSRFTLMSRAAAASGLDATLVRANRRDQVSLPEPRPADVSLDTSRLARLLPDLRRPAIEEVLAS